MFSRTGIAICMISVLASPNCIWGQEIHWAPNVAAARKASMEYKVPLLIHFYGDDCLPCKVVEQNVLSRKEVIETLNKYFICVKVNASQDRQAAAEYGVHSWPTDVFISPDGQKLDQGVCKQSAVEYLSVLHGVAVMNRDRNVMLAAEQSNKASQVTSQVASYAPPAAVASGLPAAGQASSGNPNGPNFYVQGAGTAMQQLPNSLPPNAQVTSGPILSQDQPHAVTTAVQAGGSQIASASGQHALNTNDGHLPPMQFNAQVTGTQTGRGTDPLAALVTTAPTVPAAPTVATPAVNAWNQPQTTYASSSKGQTLENPHFISSPAAAANSPKIPASTVSFQPRNALSIEANTLGDNSASVAPAANSSVAAQATVPKPETSVAMDGYCPVALKTQAAWVVGQPQYSVKHRGRIYHLSSPEAMRQFLQNPDSSSPVLSGYDAMIFLSEGKLVEGNIQYGLHEQVSGTILLFASPESKASYEQDFDRNTQALKVVLKNAGVAQ